MPGTRRRIAGEFKAEAVRLLEQSSRTLQAVAGELGVHPNQLRTWRDEHLTDLAFKDAAAEFLIQEVYERIRNERPS